MNEIEITLTNKHVKKIMKSTPCHINHFMAYLITLKHEAKSENHIAINNLRFIWRFLWFLL